MSSVIFRFIKVLLLFLLATGALIFAALNPSPVAVEFAFLQTSSSLGLALIGAAVVGLLAGILWRVNWVAQLLAERGRLRRALRLAEAKVRERAAAADVANSAMARTETTRTETTRTGT